MEVIPNLIIGAGLTGLSFARHLELGGAGESAYRILEALPETDECGPTIGGAARSKIRGEFIFDITGHWLHLRDPEIKSWVHGLMGDGLVTAQRRAAIFSHGMQTPYPFQANTYGLPTHVVADCLLGFFAAKEKRAAGMMPEPKSFEDYIRANMGDGIAEHFMIPYNTKIWTVPPAEMAYSACKRFVPIPSAQEVVLGAITPGGANHALGYNASFVYPKDGGIGLLAAAIAGSLGRSVEYDSGITRIDWREKKVQRRDGEWLPYERLISTMALDKLCKALVDAPDAVRSAAAKLRATCVTYWDLGFAGEGAADAPMWIYFPEAAFPFYRVGSPSAAYPHLAPKGHRSYYVECAHGRDVSCPASLEDVLAGLRRAGLVGTGEEPVLAAEERIDGAYVILDHDHEQARDEIIEWLEARGIFSAGRYGSWTYDSMEGALLAGKGLAERLGYPG